MRETNEFREPEELEPQELDKKMAKFFMVAKKDKPNRKGDYNYQPVSINAFQASLKRYLQEKKYKWNILTDDHFSHNREVKNAKLKQLKSMGKGNAPNRADSFTPEEIERLYEYGQLGRGENNVFLCHGITCFVLNDQYMESFAKHVCKINKKQ